jgi:hypothetical protein
MVNTVETNLESVNNNKKNMRAVALTSLAGTSIEWYDFFLYGTAAALVFPSAFFPESTPTMALILSFGTFALHDLWEEYCSAILATALVAKEL